MHDRSHLTRRGALAGIGASLLSAGAAAAQARRIHTATESQPLTLVPAGQDAGRNQVSIRIEGARRIVESNGIPDHAVGRFPNGGNPNRIRAQSYRFDMPVAPRTGGGGEIQRGVLLGVAVNGVPFDPGTAEYWQGDPSTGWRYEALGGAVALGLDANYAHVQPNGAYHYHGLPIGLMQALGWRADRPSPLIGWAADGFPIYAMTAEIDGKVVEMTSSWQSRSGARPGGSAPDGDHDGTFVQDYAHVPGSGRLDARNGATVRTDEYPGGTYAYFLTRAFPFIPRDLAAPAEPSFRRGPPGGPRRPPPPREG